MEYCSFREKFIESYINSLPDTQAKEQSLTLKHLQGPFLVTFCGLIVSTLTCILEVCMIRREEVQNAARACLKVYTMQLMQFLNAATQCFKVCIMHAKKILSCTRKWWKSAWGMCKDDLKCCTRKYSSLHDASCVKTILNVVQKSTQVCMMHHV